MRRFMSLQSINLILLPLIVFTATISGCGPEPTPTPPDKLTNRKVIVAHAGEVTRDTRYVGEFVRYKIYYVNNTKLKADIVIVDKLDTNLSQVTAHNSGVYEQRSHRIVWLIKDVSPGRGGYVEFKAAVGKSRYIRNKALIYTGQQLDPRSLETLRTRAIKTNTTTIRVLPQPKLGWIPFGRKSKPGDVPISYMKDETTTGMMVNFDVPGMSIHEVKVDGVIYHRLSIPGRATLTEVGKPELPIVGQLIEVPFGVDFEIEIVESQSIILRDYRVYPAQKPEVDQRLETPLRRPSKHLFYIDKSIYARKANYPAELAAIRLEDVGIIRGHRVVFLKVNPVQYNPVNGQIKAFSNIEVRLKYNHPAQIEPVSKRIRSEAFEQLLHASVLNYKSDFRLDLADTPGRAKYGCDYLIITHGNFYNPNDNDNPLVRFRNWKQQKGYKTLVVDVSDIPNGDTSGGIKEYMQNIYNNWYPVPTYVLLVGDSEFVPTHYNTDHPFDPYHNAKTGTDLYYTTVQGNDYFPDIFIGRISVDTINEANDVIVKILNYEKNPPGNANFYTDASLVALFEDDTDFVGDPEPEDGREDRPWIECVEEIREYLNNNAYNTDRIYTTSSGFPADPASDVPQQYEDGTNLPVDLTLAGNPAAGIPGFPWNGSGADITGAINAGRFLVTYRDHGGRAAWSGFFGFDTGDVAALANGNLTPVVFSIACENGWFDNETDDDANLVLGGSNTSNNDECFCEDFLLHNAGGAVGIIGATRVSWTGKNDFFMFGLHKAIWPDFTPNPPFTASYPTIPAIETGPIVRMGQVNTFGKLYMANGYTHDMVRQLTFEMYHVFGDPEMPIWTEEPRRLKIEHPEGAGSTGEQDFIVKVADDASGDPIHIAVVAITRGGGGSLVASRHTNPAGIARFTLNSLGTGDIDITVTAHNYRPVESTIKVVSGGAVINRLNPEDGIEDQPFNIGGQNFAGSESIKIYFGDGYILTTPASNGNFGQSGVENISITVPLDYDLGPVNVVAHGQNSDRYAVDVFRVRTANPIDLYTYSQWDESTWHLANNERTWNNPEIQLYDQNGNSVGSNNLVALNTYTIKAKIHNDTNFNAQGVKVTFTCANFGVGQDQVTWTHIGTDTLDVPANDVREAEIQWAPTTGHRCILVEIYHLEDIKESNNKGQENCNVSGTASPTEIAFEVWNPTKKPTAVFLELRQLTPSAGPEQQLLWGTWIKHPYPQVIPPGEKRKAIVIIDPDSAISKVRPGQKAEFVLTGYIDGQVIGGVNFTITKDKK